MFGITVREAMELPQMEGAVLMGGEKGIDRIIQSVNIMEVPDIEKFIKPNELLLTTAYPLKDNQRALEKLIPELNRQGLSALAIKPERYIPEIPKIMIEQAEQYGFPLIKLPNYSSFNEIINPILTEILHRQAAILQRNEKINSALTEIILHGGGLNGISMALARLLGCPVSIHDPDFRKISSCLTPRDFGVTKNRLLSELAKDSRRLAAAYKKREGKKLTFSTGGISAVCRPVTVEDEVYGYLFIWEPEKHLSAREMVGIDQAVTAIALEISKQHAVFDVESRFKRNFIEDIIDGKISSKEDAVVLAERFGWELANGFSVILFESSYLQQLYSQDPVQARQKRLKMLDTVARIVELLSPGSAIVERGSQLMLLHAFKNNSDTKQFRMNSEILAESCVKELEKVLNWHVAAGISRYIDDPLSIAEGIKQAQKALKVGSCTPGRERVFHFDDLGVYRILLTSDTKEIDKFYEDILGRLVSYDKKNKGELVETLEALFANEMNLQKTAEQLFIHYNTMRYRVNRIQQITGLDLKSPEDCLSLQLALKIFHMKK